MNGWTTNRCKAGMLAAVGLLSAVPSAAQIRTVDPNTTGQAQAAPSTLAAEDVPEPQDVPPATTPVEPSPASQPAVPAGAHSAEERAKAEARGDTYEQKDLLDAAEGTFGKGAAGLADLIQKVLKKQGYPNAYIAGREVSGALGVGLRYGSGTLFHKVEGDRPIYWTGPSLGFDVGANGSKTFVLLYNLYDSADLLHRFPAAEGTLYVVGGFTASYMRRGDIVLIPIRLGVGWRAGVNVGYMRFTNKSHILPF